MRRSSLRVVTALRAVRVLDEVVTRKHKLESTFLRIALADRLDAGAAALLRDICSGTLRHLDHYERLIEYGAPPRVVADPLLRLLTASTLYQTEQMDRAPSAALLREAAAECCRPLERPWASQPVREFCEGLAGMSYAARDEMHTPASALSLPRWLHQQLRKQRAPLDDFAPLLLRRPESLCLYVPPSQYDGGRAGYAERELRRHDATLRSSPSPLAPHALLVHSRPRHVDRLPGVAERRVHVQDAVQQFAPSVLARLQPGQRVLDACAAPGGKSRALLSMHPSGVRLVAVERHPRKAAALRAQLGQTAKAYGLQDDAVEVHCADVADASAWWDGVPFDAALIDAPCSATGLLRTLPEVKAHVSEDSVSTLCALQARLLRAVWPTLREGGECVYATCSILDRENGQIVRDFVRDAADAAVVPIDVPCGAAAATRHTSHGVVFYPSEEHQGGFVALLRKGGAASDRRRSGLVAAGAGGGSKASASPERAHRPRAARSRPRSRGRTKAAGRRPSR